MTRLVRLLTTPLGWVFIGPLLVWTCAVWLIRVSWATLRWTARHWRYSVACLIVTFAGHLSGVQRVREAGYSWLLLPALVSAAWSSTSPASYLWFREGRKDLANRAMQPGFRVWLGFGAHVAQELAGFAALATIAGGRWARTHPVAPVVGVVSMGAGFLIDSGLLVGPGLAVAFLPSLVSGVMNTWSSAAYHQGFRDPLERVLLLRWVAGNWGHIARECGLSVLRDDEGRQSWVSPTLVQLRADRLLLVLVIRARLGQVPEDIEKAVPALQSAIGAKSARVRSAGPDTVEVVLTMDDVLAPVEVVALSRPRLPHDLDLGRRQDGSRWRLSIQGRHTLVVGCSGSGKGSVLWGICGGLAPAAANDVVRLWGIDLKRGVEMSMGLGLFTRVATEPAAALGVLMRLRQVIDERGRTMAGVTRAHEPVPGDPLHVLAINELAVLTAYADLEIRREASRLLAEILTQGRALGVVVVACVQDPRKETVGMRGLFTQVVALRLRSAEETRMALGDGLPDNVKPHRINAAAPGTGWIVDDSGDADLVRADFWPDELLRSVTQRHRLSIRRDGDEAKPANPQDAVMPSRAQRSTRRRSSPPEEGAA